MVSEISNENHPVEVGLSDALYIDVPLAGSGGPSELTAIVLVHVIYVLIEDYNNENNHNKLLT